MLYSLDLSFGFRDIKVDCFRKFLDSIQFETSYHGSYIRQFNFDQYGCKQKTFKCYTLRSEILKLKYVKKIVILRLKPLFENICKLRKND